MLDKNPDQRPSATECLNHSWFKDDFKSFRPSDL